MESILKLAFVILIICVITFFTGVVKLFTKKDSNSTAIKMILISLIIIVIMVSIGIGFIVSAISNCGSVGDLTLN